MAGVIKPLSALVYSLEQEVDSECQPIVSDAPCSLLPSLFLFTTIGICPYSCTDQILPLS